MRNAGPDESRAEIKTAARNISNLRYTDDTTLRAESKEELKSRSLRVKEETERAGLKLNVQKLRFWSHHFMGKEGEKWKQWQTLFSWAPKPLWTVTAAMKLKDACYLEGKL